MLALNREIDETLFWNKVRIIVVLGIFKIDQVSPLEPEDSYPMELTIITRVVVLPYAGIDASPAADATGKFKTISPEAI